ncbi:hypothetical protein PV328_003487 [Microctonus aethiopoides]|uniref:Uncharacterized protein n=1 Tax=Microctonus aethiopoides TaxID=144406 RepID=A0AA39KKQ0_9HYME|nr:hypothetical protein PV328_003487 [Microctonus aethiopoides]
MKLMIFIIIVFTVYSFMINACECKSGKTKQFDLQSKETNIPNFVRLVVMRLIFGIATSMGFGDRVAGFLGGILVPPGAEDYSDYGDDYGFDGGDIF